MKKIIIGNWKLNLDHLQGIQLLQKINYSLPKDVEENIDKNLKRISKVPKIKERISFIKDNAPKFLKTFLA